MIVNEATLFQFIVSFKSTLWNVVETTWKCISVIKVQKSTDFFYHNRSDILTSPHFFGDGGKHGYKMIQQFKARNDA